MIHQTNVYQIEYERHLFFRHIRIFLISFFVCLVAMLFMKILTRGVEKQTIGDFTYELDSTTMAAKITKYNGSDEAVNIEGTINYGGNDYAVTVIGKQAFLGNQTIKSLTGNSILKIGDSALKQCKKLETVEFNNVIFVSNWVFASTSLKKIDLPNVIFIGHYTFNDCPQLEEVSFPELIYLESHVFYDYEGSINDKIKTLYLPKVTFIANQSFKLGAIEKIILPNLIFVDKHFFTDVKNGLVLEVPKTIKNLLEVLPNRQNVSINYVYERPNSKLLNNSFKNINELENKINKIKEALSEEYSKYGVEIKVGGQHEYTAYDNNRDSKYYAVNFYTDSDIYEYERINQYFLFLVAPLKTKFLEKGSTYEHEKEITTLEYNGNDQTPEVKITDGKYELKKDVDYKLICDNFTDAGKEKSVFIEFIGDYFGLDSIRQNFEITPKDASNFDIEYEKIHIYDGKNPEFKIKGNEKELVLDMDYKIISDKDIKEIGTHNVKIQYIGNYTGEKNDIKFDVVVDKSNWGEEIDNHGVINYVDSHGKTSAEVTGNNVVWLKESSDNTSAWYAVDNSNGTFRIGSRFWVQWLSPENDKKEFEKYYNKLDDEYKKQVENNKLWIFLTGVTDPDGNDYANLDGNIGYYIQLGEDWDKNDVKAVFIDDHKDSVLEVSYENLMSPEGNKEFAKLSMKHFSPYLIYDSISPNVLPDDKNSDSSKNSEEDNKKIKSKNLVYDVNSGLVLKISILVIFILTSTALIILYKLKYKSNKKL